MTDDNDPTYYLRREAVSRELADASSDRQIKRIHTELADQYAARVQQLMSQPKAG